MREINNIIKILLSRVILLLSFWEFTLIYSLNWGELTCIIYQDDYNQHGNEIILLFYLVFSGFCDIKKTIGIGFSGKIIYKWEETLCMSV